MARPNSSFINVQLLTDLHNSDCTEANTQFFPNASDEEIQPWLHTRKDQLIVLAIFPIILVFGLCTNGLFLLVLARVKAMRTVTNYYLAHLACCDVAFILLLSGETLYHHSVSPPIKYILYKTATGCFLVTFLQHVSLYASMTLITMVSVERFMAICYPVTHRLVGGMQRTKHLVAATWIWSIVLGAVSAPLYGAMRKYCVIWPERDRYNSFPLVIHRCEAVLPFFRSFTRALRLAYFTLAVIINCYVYCRIIRKLNNRIQPVASIQSSGSHHPDRANNDQARKSSHRVAAMLIANGVIFFMCLAPFRMVEIHILMVELGNARHLGWVNTLAAVGLWTWGINSTVNPVIYGLANSRYRKSFWKVFTCSSTTEIDTSVSQTNVVK